MSKAPPPPRAKIVSGPIRTGTVDVGGIAVSPIVGNVVYGAAKAGAKAAAKSVAKEVPRAARRIHVPHPDQPVRIPRGKPGGVRLPDNPEDIKTLEQAEEFWSQLLEGESKRKKARVAAQKLVNKIDPGRRLAAGRERRIEVAKTATTRIGAAITEGNRYKQRKPRLKVKGAET